MSEGNKNLEPVRPARNLLIGMGFPILAVLVFGLVGVGMSLTNGKGELMYSFKFAAGVGLFFVLLGVFEIALGILFLDGRFKNRVWMLLGFALSWSAMATVTMTML